MVDSYSKDLSFLNLDNSLWLEDEFSDFFKISQPDSTTPTPPYSSRDGLPTPAYGIPPPVYQYLESGHIPVPTPSDHQSHHASTQPEGRADYPLPSSSTASTRPQGRSSNPVPRHKRPSHINAEHKRRGKIQKGFNMLKELVPALAEENNSSTRDSKHVKLHRTVQHVRSLEKSLREQETEKADLRREINELNAEIRSYQSQLPTTGLPKLEKPPCHIETAYNEYLMARTRENWTFWMFSFILRPLFESYKHMVSTTNLTVFCRNVQDWAHEHLSLVNLRPCVLSALRSVSLRSSILSHPEQVPNEAIQMVTEYCNSASSDCPL